MGGGDDAQRPSMHVREVADGKATTGADAADQVPAHARFVVVGKDVEKEVGDHEVVAFVVVKGVGAQQAQRARAGALVQLREHRW